MSFGRNIMSSMMISAISLSISTHKERARGSTRHASLSASRRCCQFLKICSLPQRPAHDTCSIWRCVSARGVRSNCSYKTVLWNTWHAPNGFASFPLRLYSSCPTSTRIDKPSSKQLCWHLDYARSSAGQMQPHGDSEKTCCVSWTCHDTVTSKNSIQCRRKQTRATKAARIDQEELPTKHCATKFLEFSIVCHLLLIRWVERGLRIAHLENVLQLSTHFA